jgi:ribonuclease R
MDKTDALEIGAVEQKNGSLFVKEFVFSGERPLVPLSGGKVVTGDIVHYRKRPDGTAEFSSIIASHGSARSEIFSILEKRQVTIPYPDDVILETEMILGEPGIDDPNLEDLTDLPFITIDNEGSRDLDQALYIDTITTGFRVYYALADCGYYIKPGSALFREARERGATFYLPEFSVPMLPPALSEGVISLNPDVDRRALIFSIDINPDGTVAGYRCFQGRIHSRAQLTYNGVQNYYDGNSTRLAGTEYVRVLDLLREVGLVRIKLAAAGNRVTFHRRETVTGFSNDGSSFTLTESWRNDCSRYNEQVSLLCNAIGAQMLKESDDPDVQGIYRIHKSPEEDDLQRLEQVIEELVTSHGISNQAWLWSRSRETISDWLERVNGFNENSHLVEALERQVMITMQRSEFTETAGLHYALAMNPYSRFSSPMREIVGIYTHKEALEFLGRVHARPVDEDLEMRDEIIRAGNRARDKQKTLERDVLRSVIDTFFSQEIKKEASQRTVYKATILGAKATRLYVSVDNLPLELKVYTSHLEDHLSRSLELDGPSMVYKDTGDIAFKPGDRISLMVAGRDGGRWIFIPVSGGTFT